MHIVPTVVRLTHKQATRKVGVMFTKGQEVNVTRTSHVKVLGRWFKVPHFIFQWLNR